MDDFFDQAARSASTTRLDAEAATASLLHFLKSRLTTEQMRALREAFPQADRLLSLPPDRGQSVQTNWVLSLCSTDSHGGPQNDGRQNGSLRSVLELMARFEWAGVEPDKAARVTRLLIESLAERAGPRLARQVERELPDLR